MITYNWLKVYNKSSGKAHNILNIMAFITFRPIPKNDFDTNNLKYAQINWNGDSFLINPSAVIYNRSRVDEKHLADYVALASFRSLAEYKVTKRKTLSLQECPVSLESLTQNPLLSIIDGEIYFCWEETTH